MLTHGGGVERLPKVEDFNCKFLADHDIGHLDV